jgi:hypothetical protein
MEDFLREHADDIITDIETFKLFISNLKEHKSIMYDDCDYFNIGRFKIQAKFYSVCSEIDIFDQVHSKYSAFTCLGQGGLLFYSMMVDYVTPPNMPEGFECFNRRFKYSSMQDFKYSDIFPPRKIAKSARN